MRRQPVSFEWHVTEDEESWHKLTLDEVTSVADRHQRMDFERALIVHLLRGVAVIFAGIVLVAGADLSPEEDQRLRATAGIEALLLKEAYLAGQLIAQEQNGNEAFNPLLADRQGGVQLAHYVTDKASLEDIGVGLVRVEPLGAMTLAEVVLSRSDLGWRETNPYRETRFYRETTNGWRQTSPDRTFWGNTLHRETTHLRFAYFARDATTVEPLIDQLEAIYQTLYARLGLAPAHTTQKLTIEITPNPVSGRGIDEDRLRVTSPIMSQIPSEFSSSTFLSHQIVSRMVSAVIMSDSTLTTLRIARAESFSSRWRGLRRGLRSWLQRELMTELMIEPWPWDQQAAELFLQLHQEQLPLTLPDIFWGVALGQTDRQLSDDERMMWQNAAAESLIAYTVATYGQERLLDLLRGIHQYRDWDEFVPGVIGVSVAEFEAGWNHYLAQQAGLPFDEMPLYRVEP